jgi:hypothetical protein
MDAPYISLDDLNFEAVNCSADDFKKLLKTYRSSFNVEAMQNATDGVHYHDNGDDGYYYNRYTEDQVVDRQKKKEILIDFRAGLGEFAPEPKQPGPLTRLFEGLAARLGETQQTRELKATVADLTARLEKLEKQAVPANPAPAMSIKL